MFEFTYRELQLLRRAADEEALSSQRLHIKNLRRWRDKGWFGTDNSIIKQAQRVLAERRALREKIDAMMDDQLCERCKKTPAVVLLGKGIIVCRACIWTGEDQLRDIRQSPEYLLT